MIHTDNRYVSIDNHDDYVDDDYMSIDNHGDYIRKNIIIFCDRQ